MRILGIDPGFERIGIAIVEKNPTGKEMVVFSECFKTKANLPFEKRLLQIGDQIKKISAKYNPKILAIETLFLNSNQKTVMNVAEARGVILYECSKRGLQIFEASPPQIKKAVTGDGRADKKQVIKMVKMLVKINDSKTSDDELDAIAIALCAMSSIR